MQQGVSMQQLVAVAKLSWTLQVNCKDAFSKKMQLKAAIEIAFQQQNI